MAVHNFGYPDEAQAVRDSVAQLPATLGFLNELTGIDALVCYAVKANSNLAVLDVFARRGAGFDIVSGGELRRVLAAGAGFRLLSPRRTMLASSKPVVSVGAVRTGSGKSQTSRPSSRTLAARP